MIRKEENTSFGDGMNIPEMHRTLKEATPKRDPKIWRSLKELAAHEDGFVGGFKEAVSDGLEGVDRRDFMKLMGASMSLAGLTACTKQPEERIVPYVDAPEEIVPGNPLFYATTITLEGYGIGVLAESHMGRPTSVIGNKEHPASQGASDPIVSASILNLYDTARSTSVFHRSRPRDWKSCKAALAAALEPLKAQQGEGIYLLVEPSSSPTLARQLESLIKGDPKAAAEAEPGEKAKHWPKISIHYDEPTGRQNARAGAQLAFGKDLDAVYQTEKADVVLALDADYLTQAPGQQTTNAIGHGKRRSGVNSVDGFNRVYSVESTLTPTGTTADHRLAVKAGKVEHIGRAVAAKIGLNVAESAFELTEFEALFVDKLAADLLASKGASLVIAGEHQPPAVHALAHAMNDVLGNVSKTVTYVDSVVKVGQEANSFGALVEAFAADKVKALIMVGANPVYTSGGDVDFATLVRKAGFSLHVGMTNDETGQYCDWHVPQAHYLEYWSDARSIDGTYSIVQPLIQPLYDGKSPHDILAAVAGKEELNIYKLIRSVWMEQLGKKDAEFDVAWRKVVHDGMLADSASSAAATTVKKDFLNTAAPLPKEGEIEMVIKPDPFLGDGRYANNAWLQELPRPVTTMCWDNAVIISPATAKRKNLYKSLPERKTTVPKVKKITLSIGDEKIPGALLVVPGHADDSITVYLGGGRTFAGDVGNGVGFDFYSLRTAAAPSIVPKVTIRLAGGDYPLAMTQDHHFMQGRDHLRSGTVKRFKDNAHFAKDPHTFGHEYTLYGNNYDEIYKHGNQWAMVIDLNACIGCNNCIVACQSENNIPTVGKKEVLNGREMHWIRVDRYYEGTEDDVWDPNKVRNHAMPVTCFQCENAPCETVCPVGATVHSNEGLNQMVYNRCVGTRYCSNNCPYHVRRFNYFKFTDDETESAKLQRNPDVTVRLRGVMEKCTYCVQRINLARIDLKKNYVKTEGEPENVSDRLIIPEGSFQTACQESCPTSAIHFGSKNAAHGEERTLVAKLQKHDLRYSLLEEINTRPRTSYLALVRNNNEDLEATPADSGHGHGGHGGHKDPEAGHGPAPHGKESADHGKKDTH
ncbi:MAG: Fe-S-cluster-containing dehydrogenase component [Candidatus Omnitrophota bacterium]|jgi:Fe-S-cluster-containing dehydrogenase component